MKVATVDVEALFRLMPAAVEAQASYNEMNDRYRREYDAMQKDFGESYAQYQALSADAATPASILQRRTVEILEDNDKIDRFLATSRTELASYKAQLEAPIYDELHTAIAAVAAEQGITYVIDSSKAVVVYAGPDAIDITPDVKKRLNIK